VPDGTAVFGFVYGSQGVYGSVPGRAYLVSAEGETDVDALRDRVPDGYEACVRRLL
jgi:carbonic anhydrase